MKSSGRCSLGAARLSREDVKVEGVHPSALPTCQQQGASSKAVTAMVTARSSDARKRHSAK